MAQAVACLTNDEKKDNAIDFNYMKSVWDKYDSIQNFKCDDKHKKSMETLDYLSQNGHLNDGIDWVATEKVHGCNFSILTNGKEFYGARRGDVLKPGDSFISGWEKLIDNEKNKIFKLFSILNNKNSKINVVIIYGEIFGQNFSHSDEKYQIKNKKAIQKGVYYTPDLCFYAFDIKTNLQNNEETRLEYNKSRYLFEQCGILQGDILTQGKLTDVVNFDVNKFQSTIPKLLGLPHPVNKTTGELIDNLAEGIVVRKLTGSNFLFKIKATKFDEIVSNAAKQERREKKQEAKEKNENNAENMENIRKETVNTIGQPLIGFIDSCVNDNRLAAATSKIGQLTNETLGKIGGMMIQDVLKELQTEKKDEIEKMTKKNHRLMRVYVASVVNEFVASKAENNE